MAERVRERKVDRKPSESVTVGPPSRLVKGLAVALESVPTVYEKDIEKGAKIVLGLLMYYDPATESWYPASAPKGVPETAVKAFKPDTNTYEYLRLDPYYNLYVTLRDTTIALPIDIQYRRKESFTCFSGTVTANGNSADIDVSNYSAAELILKVTGVSGTTPTLNIYIEGKFDTTGDYKVLFSQEGITTTGIWYFTITQLIFKTIRVKWVVGGTTPSFTFRVDAVAMV